MLTKIMAFVRRDLQSARSYRLAYGLQAVGVIVPLIGLYFMSRVFNTVDIGVITRPDILQTVIEGAETS